MTVLPDRWVNRWTAPVLRAVFLGVAFLLGLLDLLVLSKLDNARQPTYDLQGLVLTAVPLAVIALIASLRPTGEAVSSVQPIAESLGIGAVIGTSDLLDGPGGLFAPLLVVSVFVAGQRSNLLGALISALVGTVPWLAVTVVVATGSSADGYSEVRDVVTVGAGIVGAGIISAWTRRLLDEARPQGDTGAYTDAFRLLSELQHVARNLSLGLDPVTLATALVDDLRAAVPQSRAAVAIRGQEGRFAPLVGHLDDADHGVASQAWLSTTVSERDTDGDHRLALPVMMGERVIAVAVLGGAELSAAQRVGVADVVRTAGPRLAAALLFDEVRQLATVDERLRLAREIHDGIAQELASLGYLLDDLTGRVPADAAGEVRVLREHVRRVTSELRLSIFDLRAGVDDEVTLGAALAEHVQRVAGASRLVAHTMIDEQGDRLPTGSEIELLRIAQEALTNIRKHAAASNVWIDCVVDAPNVMLRIVDDGVGLKPARPGSMGMRGMRERARRIGGSLTVTDREGGGTIVEVRFGDPDLESTHVIRSESIA